jgi:Ca2+-binding RTX toxin-like protein
MIPVSRLTDLAPLPLPDTGFAAHAARLAAGGTTASVADPGTTGDEIILATRLSFLVYGDGVTPDAAFRYDLVVGSRGGTVLDAGDLGLVETPGNGFTDYGLYQGTPVYDGTAVPNSAEALVVQTEIDGETTVVLAFRGTDDLLAASLFGEATTAAGTAAYYESLYPLIEAVIAYVNDPANSVENFVVTGHSLGGTMADMFTLYDAQHVDQGQVDLSVVSIGSAGIDFQITGERSGWDSDVATVLPFIGLVDLTPPDYYTGISTGEDYIYDPSLSNFNGLNPLLLLAIPVLIDNVNFTQGQIEIEFPTFGHAEAGDSGEHAIALYVIAVEAVWDSALADQFAGQDVIMGSPEATGIYADATWPVDDAGAFALVGTARDEFILGLGGDDELTGLGGADLLDGGAGNDMLDGGAGMDYLHGGTGADMMAGGADADVFVWQRGDGADTISDFELTGDVVSVEGFGINLAQGARAADQVGDDVVIDLGGGDVLTLSGTQLTDLGADDFVLV